MIKSFLYVIRDYYSKTFDIKSRVRKREAVLIIFILGILYFSTVNSLWKTASECNTSVAQLNSHICRENRKLEKNFSTRMGEAYTIGPLFSFLYNDPFIDILFLPKFVDYYGGPIAYRYLFPQEVATFRVAFPRLILMLFPLPALLIRRLKDAGAPRWLILLLLFPFVRYLVLYIIIFLPSNRLPTFKFNKPIKSFGLDEIPIFFKKLPLIYKNVELRVQGKVRKCAKCSAPINNIYDLKCNYCGYENKL